MAKLKPKDRVEWRAGGSPSTTHMRTGVIKELLPEGIAMVRTKVEGVSRIEEIRAARLRLVEPPPKPARRRKAKRRRARKAAAGKKAAKQRGKRKKALKSS